MSSPLVNFAEGTFAQRERLSAKFSSVSLLIGIWLLLVWIILDVTEELYQTTILLLILTALVLPLLIALLRDNLDIFEPIIFANVGLASMFIGRPLIDIGKDRWIIYWFGTYQDVRPGFNDMLWVALVGIIAFQLGYYSIFSGKFARRLPRLRGEINYDRAVTIAIFVFILGMLLFAEYVRESGGLPFLLALIVSRDIGREGFSFKTASGYLSIGPLLWPPAALIAFSAWQHTRKPSQLRLAIFILLVFFSLSLGSGARTVLIQGILGILTLWYVGSNRRPGLLLGVASVLAGLLFLAYSRQTRTLHTFDQKVAVVSQMSAHPLDSIATIWTEDDASMADYFSVIVDSMPTRVGWGNGSTLTDMVLRATPRFLLPNNQKPDEHVVLVFKVIFSHVYYHYSSGAACSLIGELYEDHGTATAAIGMFLLGIILGMIKPWLLNTHNALPVQLLYVVMPAYTTTLMRGGVPNFFQLLAITAVPMVILAKFCTRPAPALQT